MGVGRLSLCENSTGPPLATIQKPGTILFSVCGPALFAPLFMIRRVLKDQRVRFPVAAGGLYALCLCLNAWLFPSAEALVARVLTVTRSCRMQTRARSLTTSWPPSSPVAVHYLRGCQGPGTRQDMAAIIGQSIIEKPVSLIRRIQHPTSYTLSEFGTSIIPNSEAT